MQQQQQQQQHMFHPRPPLQFSPQQVHAEPSLGGGADPRAARNLGELSRSGMEWSVVAQGNKKDTNAAATDWWP